MSEVTASGGAGSPEGRQFPIQSERGARPHPLLIPWNIAELAYSVYVAEYGRSQSLERLAERGGFGPSEMDMFLPDWRERCDGQAAAIRAAEADAGEAVARRAADVVRAAEPFIGKEWAKSLADEIERDAAAIRARGAAP